MERLQGRAALVTGAASGIGKAIARGLASDDAAFVTGLELFAMVWGLRPAAGRRRLGRAVGRL